MSTGKKADKAKTSTKSRTYATVDELVTVIDKYFDDCDREHKLYNEAGLALALGVQLRTLVSWYEGERCPEFQDAVRFAYLRIQDQIESDPAYQDKSMSTRAIFLLKQKRLGGKQDKIEAKQDIAVNVKMGSGMEESDFA